MISTDQLFGGSQYVAVTAPTTPLAIGLGRAIYLDVSGAGIGGTVDLPDARTVPLGWPAMYLVCVGGGVTVQDKFMNPLFGLAAGEVVRLNLVNNSAAGGIWSWRIRTAGAPPAAAFDVRAHHFGGDGVADDEVGQFDNLGGSWLVDLAPALRDMTDAAAATDGRKVWVFGDTDAIDQAKVEEYDRSTDTWTTKATAAPHGLRKPGALYHGGHVYIFGGGVGAGNERKAYKYNPVDETFSVLADVPAIDTAFQAVSVNGRLHVMGPNSHYIYDQDADTYEARAVRPGGWRDYGLCFFFDRILACGGDDNLGNATAEAHTYKYTADTWLPIPDMPAARSRLGAVHIGSKRMIAFGGDDGAAVPVAKTNSYYYDGSTWTTLSALAAARTDLNRVSLPLIA